MRLTSFSDYSLRVLIYLGTTRERLATIDEIAAAYGISGNHLMKVVHHLGRHGYVETVRGKGGGMRLARAPESINVGQVTRTTEDSFALVECFEGGEPDCRIARVCVLRQALSQALEAFLAALDRYTLADLLAPERPLTRILAPRPPARDRATHAAPPRH
ncbi:MAG TPA: Rrf2 family transcriptional regulator [Casimicrobiaceae bacterium]|nr:Rrf2 family transcriptional regulator [Casimicrobiaceae bacterium]